MDYEGMFLLLSIIGSRILNHSNMNDRASGNISVLAMRPDSSRSVWCLSPYMTAFRLLNIIAVVNSVLSIRGIAIRK